MSWGVALRNAVGLGLGGIPSLLNAPPYAKLAFNFLSGELDPRITFSRTTNATLIGSDGQLQYAPHNLLTYSEQFDNAAWTKTQSTIAANSVAAPNGTTTADKLVEDSTTNTHFALQTFTASASRFTASFYAKAAERSFTRAVLGDGTSFFTAYFNLANGTVGTVTGTGTEAIITPEGNGWYRCSVSAVCAAGSGGFNIRTAIANGSDNYLGDGVSGIYAWGAQLNVGALQPYYPTTVKNLLGYTQEFDNAAWFKSAATITANTASAPDGSLTADKLVEDTATVGHYITPSPALSLVVGRVLTYSVYAKAAERTFLQLILTGVGPAAANLTAGFDLTTGVAGTPSAGSTSSIVSVGNGWYRCGITTPIATAGTPTQQIRVAQNSSSTPSSYTGDGTSGIFIWGAQFSDSASLDPYKYNPAAAPSNTAYYGPRLDYDPVTLEAKGRLIEEQRTNSIRNNTMVGAVAGTPGTAPTNWLVVSGGGLSREITAVGSEAGVSYFDIRFFGTGSSVAAQRVYVESSVTVAAANGQAWSLSAYVKLVAGTAPSGLFIGFDETGPGATYIRTDSASLPLTSTLTRNTYSATLSGGVNVAFILPQIGFNSAIGVAVDFTLRIGLPQLELGAFATSVIPTTTTALTRAADVLSIIGANFSNWYNPVEGTTYVEASTLPNVTAATLTYAISDNTFNNSIYGNFSAGNSYRGANVAVAGIGQVNSIGTFGIASSTNNTKDAFAYKQDNFGESCNGATTRTDNLGTVPVVNRLYIGTNWDGNGNFLNGHIRSFKYYNTRLRDSALQLLTR